MDWDRIKTIFIVTFFVLDLFLIFQFIQKQDSNQLELVTETKIDQQLKAEKITMGNFPKEPKKESFIMAKNKGFQRRRCAIFKKSDSACARRISNRG